MPALSARSRAAAPSLFLLVLFATPAFANTFTVDTGLDAVDASPGDGICANANGACSLRAAIMEANALAGADTTVLPIGHFTTSIAGIAENDGTCGDLDVTDDLTIVGQGSRSSVIDGGAIDRVLDLRAASGRSIVLSELSLVNGNIPDAHTGDGSAGAGLRVGAGVHLQLHAVDIRDNHTRAFGGAAGVDNFGCIEGDHVRIVDNTDPATLGSMNALAGGVWVNGDSGCLALDESELSGNAGDFAGAVALETSAAVTLRRTLIAANRSRFAGGIDISHAGDVRLENVTISGNTGNPGALLNDGGTHVYFVNSTVTGNHGSQFPSGALADVHGGFGLTFLTNTIVAGNGPSPSAPDCERFTSIGGGNIIGNTFGCTIASQPSDQLDVDPALAPLADNGGFTRTHLAGTPAIDHGVANGCPTTDQRGVPRPSDGDDNGTAECDVGAVEKILVPDAIYADGFDVPAQH